MDNNATTPAARFRQQLLTDETSDDSVLSDLQEQEFQKFCKGPGGQQLLAHLEAKRQWSSDRLMETSPSDSDKISFLQAFHFFCSEYINYLTPIPEDEDV